MGTIVKSFDEWTKVYETLEMSSQEQIEDYINNASNVFLPSFSSEIKDWGIMSMEERVIVLQDALSANQVKPEKISEVTDILDSAVLLWGE